MINITQAELNQMSFEQLRKLNEMVVSTIKLKRKQLIAQFELNIGDKVKVNHPKLQGKSLIVKQVKRTKAILQIEGTVGSYNVPISMIEF
jgi:protein involved in polysaccharide export with SLBB domain